MKPLITSANALKELATGVSVSAIEESVTLRLYKGGTFDALVSNQDKVDQQRVVISREGYKIDEFVPDHMKEHKKSVVSRIASFAERINSPGPVSLPNGWSQYKYKNLISFFAVPRNESSSTRWVAEVIPGETNDIVLLDYTTTKHKEALQDIVTSSPSEITNIHDKWREAIVYEQEKFARRDEWNSDVEMHLKPVESVTPQGWSYDNWLDNASSDQIRFIKAPTDKSIRLRGPAGSGKTAALTLKALYEVLLARDQGRSIRVLFVTHSWSLASEVSDSISAVASDMMSEIDVFPLLEIAQSISPQYVNDDSGFQLVGSDSLSGKMAQLEEVQDVLADFIDGDWITYRSRASTDLAQRLDSVGRNDRLALAWDLLTEFGSVIGPAAIFPGAGAESKYSQLPRAAWMMPLLTHEDLSIVFEIYSRYVRSLEARSLLTSDQVLSDLLSHLETHAWNRSRKSQGYDLIFVDEFHLFNHLERQVIHFLARSADLYPRVFMAVDPRQSPSEEYIGTASDSTRSGAAFGDNSLGEIDNFELTTVHRFTPEILSLIKHLHHCFPSLDLGQDWDVDFSAVESVKDSGTIPSVSLSSSEIGEENEIVRAVHDLYPRGRIALAIADSRKWRKYSRLAGDIGKSGKFHVTSISGKSDLDGLGYRKRGLVVGPAEYLAGLQFDTVLVAGLSDIRTESLANERTRLLSLLYLGVSRAEREVRIFANAEDGGVPEVLRQAIDSNLLNFRKGEAV